MYSVNKWIGDYIIYWPIKQGIFNDYIYQYWSLYDQRSCFVLTHLRIYCPSPFALVLSIPASTYIDLRPLARSCCLYRAYFHIFWDFKTALLSYFRKEKLTVGDWPITIATTVASAISMAKQWPCSRRKSNLTAVWMKGVLQFWLLLHVFLLQYGCFMRAKPS